MGDGTKENPYTREDVLRLIEENGGKAEGLDLSGKTFEAGIDLRGLDLKGIILKGAVFKNTSKEVLIQKGIKLRGNEFMGRRNIGALLSQTHLEDADLSEAHLESAFLRETYLEEAFLSGAHLEGADLSEGHLEGTSLWAAHLEGANLRAAHLARAYLWIAHLEGANLYDAHLKDADLSTSNLKGAWLWTAHLEGANLYRAIIFPDTRLENADWGNYILGEERKGQFDSAVAVYRQLKVWYTNAGYSDIAAKFYYREKEANRKALKLLSRQWNHRLALEFMRAFFGYGEHWERILVWSLAIIFGLAVVYRFGELTIPYAIYYSVVSFTALGYGKWVDITPPDWVQALGAAESVIGVLMMAFLLVTFVRKWTR